MNKNKQLHLQIPNQLTIPPNLASRKTMNETDEKQEEIAFNRPQKKHCLTQFQEIVNRKIIKKFSKSKEEEETSFFLFVEILKLTPEKRSKTNIDFLREKLKDHKFFQNLIEKENISMYDFDQLLRQLSYEFVDENKNVFTYG